MLLIGGTSLADAPTHGYIAHDVASRLPAKPRATRLFAAGDFEERATNTLAIATTFASSTGARLATTARILLGHAFRTLPQNVADAAQALDATAGDKSIWVATPIDRRTLALERNLLVTDAAAVRACAQGLEMVDGWIGHTHRVVDTDRIAGVATTRAPGHAEDGIVPLRIEFEGEDTALPAILESPQRLILRDVAFGRWPALSEGDRFAPYEPEGGAPSLTLTLRFLPALDATPGADVHTPWRNEAIGLPHGERLEIALFARRKLDAVFASGALTYATFEAMSDRAVVFGQPIQNGMSHFPAQARIERIEFGRRYDFEGNSLGITPYFAVQAEHVRMPPEDGPPVLAQPLLGTGFSPAHENDVMQEIGVQIDRSIGDLDSVTFVGRFGWVHDYAKGFAKPARIAFPGTTFDFFGPASSRDAAMLSLGIDADLARGLTLQIETQSDLSPTDRAVGGDAAIAFHW